MRRSLTATLLAATALLAACGDDGDDTASPATTVADAATTVADSAASETTTADSAGATEATTADSSDVTEMTTANSGGATAATTADSTDATEPTTADASDATGATTADSGDATAATDATTGGSSETTTAGTESGDDVPQAIVSLSPVHTEMLFAIGAGDQVIAVDDQSDYPPEVADLPNDLSGYEPNVEAIAAYEPDLVVASSDIVSDQLEELGIEVWVGPAAATLDDSYDQIEQLGAATGHIAEAAEVVGNMQTDIEAIVDGMPELDAPLSVYHELGPELYSADSTTFIGQVYSQLGLENIADEAEGDSGGYPQLSAEAIISANPDLIFLADTECCGESAETVAARDGWDEITAVTEGHVFEMSDDIASRWGPRIVDYYQQVADAVTEVAGVPAGG